MADKPDRIDKFTRGSFSIPIELRPICQALRAEYKAREIIRREHQLALQEALLQAEEMKKTHSQKSIALQQLNMKINWLRSVSQPIDLQHLLQDVIKQQNGDKKE
jgi:hypothetical protein